MKHAQQNPKPLANTSPAPTELVFLNSPLGLGYHFWKFQARAVKIEYRHWRNVYKPTAAESPSSLLR